MNSKLLLLVLLFSALFPALCPGEEYELREWRMREVEAVAQGDSTVAGDIFFLASAPVNDREFLTSVYDYADSVIISDFGRLSTFYKTGVDSLELSSIQNRLLRLSPAEEAGVIFERKKSLPQHSEFMALAEEPGRDSVEVIMAAGRVPKGRGTLVIDYDTIPSLRIIDSYLVTAVTDSISGEASWRHDLREWYDGESEFPLVREYTESLRVGNDTVVMPTVTLLAYQEAVEEVINERTTAPAQSGPGGNERIFLGAEITSPNELTVSFSCAEGNAGIEVRIYDILGRQLSAPRKTVASESVSTISFLSDSPLPGVFFVSLVSESSSETIKIVR